MSSHGFGDAEPEDAWDADDPLVELVDNIRRRVALVDAELERRAVDLPRVRQRLELIVRDLGHVIGRVGD